MWCIPPEQDAAFVCQMEQVLEVYKRPYDPRHPQVCMDEQPKQLMAEKQTPQPVQPGTPTRVDSEYIRQGVCTVWMFVEPLAGWRDVQVSERRTAVDWAQYVQQLVDHPRYAMAETITLVCDNLNTHTLASLYKAFEPQEAQRLIEKLKLVHTPKHGSWLNMAEPELSVLTRQCLSQRIEYLDDIKQQAQQWTLQRNQKQKGIDWQFTTDDARIKLKHLYPKIES
ncbi:IS630 family transposase [Leptothoe sp. PORK10 BA2]|uniref:IS630 family transposase n=1 Tax=Leptothoe sp. PORK10 BA2 TaxID=3110254 RepID=UPI002B217F5F|nr:IS630 family transposase [Leptothoe sp. PORK10 BA2]MEA5467164.1 IS630 family transposase [Leptothoe sp. PORK10 BA2]